MATDPPSIPNRATSDHLRVAASLARAAAEKSSVMYGEDLDQLTGAPFSPSDESPDHVEIRTDALANMIGVLLAASHLIRDLVTMLASAPMPTDSYERPTGDELERRRTIYLDALVAQITAEWEGRSGDEP